MTVKVIGEGSNFFLQYIFFRTIKLSKINSSVIRYEKR